MGLTYLGALERKFSMDPALSSLPKDPALHYLHVSPFHASALSLSLNRPLLCALPLWALIIPHSSY